MRVLSPEGLNERSGDPFDDPATYLDRGQFAFPVSEAARRRGNLSAGARVIGVVIQGVARAYPLANFRG